MPEAALGLWIVTALGGAYLWSTVVARSSSTDPAAGRTELPQLVLFLHPLLALSGLAVFIAFLVRDRPAELAWVAFAILLVVATLGDVLFFRTLRDRPRDRAEQQLPMPVVVGHGLLGVTTIVLVLVSALRA